MTLLVAQLDPGTTLTRAQEQALAHVVGCRRCLADLARVLGPGAACAVVESWLPALAAGHLSEHLAEALLAHVDTCSTCVEAWRDAGREQALRRLPVAEQTAARLALALLDAALADAPRSRDLLVGWLGGVGAAFRDTARLAAGPALPEIAAAGQAALALETTYNEEDLRQAALDLLADYHLEDLADLGLQVRGGALVARPAARPGAAPPRSLPTRHRLILPFRRLPIAWRQIAALADSMTLARGETEGPDAFRLTIGYDADHKHVFLRIEPAGATWDATRVVPFYVRVPPEAAPPASVPWLSWVVPGEQRRLDLRGRGVTKALTITGQALTPEQQRAAISWAQAHLALELLTDPQS